MSTMDAVCSRILNYQNDCRVLVGVNGVDGSGKTEFVKKLAATLKKKTQRQIVTISIDGFHNPKSIRYVKGRASAEGYYRDSFNLQAFEEKVLQPLKNGAGKYVPRIFDVRTDTAIDEEPIKVAGDAIVLIEGIFIFQQKLLPYFDVKIFLDVPFEATFSRMLKRDVDLHVSREVEIDLFATRYKLGQLLYFTESHPKENADILIDNTDYTAPKIIK